MLLFPLFTNNFLIVFTYLDYSCFINHFLISNSHCDLLRSKSHLQVCYKPLDMFVSFMLFSRLYKAHFQIGLKVWPIHAKQLGVRKMSWFMLCWLIISRSPFNYFYLHSLLHVLKLKDLFAIMYVIFFWHYQGWIGKNTFNDKINLNSAYR